ncbi:MAG: hypothetical protein AB3X44_16175 [Leptothrix sp. (in: b-proteobacteria)]
MSAVIHALPQRKSLLAMDNVAGALLTQAVSSAVIRERELMLERIDRMTEEGFTSGSATCAAVLAAAALQMGIECKLAIRADAPPLLSFNRDVTEQQLFRCGLLDGWQAFGVTPGYLCSTWHFARGGLASVDVLLYDTPSA